MNKALSRIERNHILSNFVKNKGTLLIITNKDIIKILPTNYEIENNIISFPSELKFPNEQVQIIFEHKKRPFCMFPKININAAIPSFSIPDEIFKYDTQNDGANIYIYIHINNNTVIKASDHYDFRLNHFFDDLRCNLSNASIIKKLNVLSDNKIHHNLYLYRINRFLKYYFEKKQNNIDFKHNTLLFIDEKMICLFLKKETCDLLVNQQNYRIKIQFEDRIMNTENAKILLKFDIKKNYSVFIFSAENMKTEDKRYLHEFVYKLKYGEKNTEL